MGSGWLSNLVEIFCQQTFSQSLMITQWKLLSYWALDAARRTCSHNTSLFFKPAYKKVYSCNTNNIICVSPIVFYIKLAVVLYVDYTGYRHTHVIKQYITYYVWREKIKNDLLGDWISLVFMGAGYIYTRELSQSVKAHLVCPTLNLILQTLVDIYQ